MSALAITGHPRASRSLSFLTQRSPHPAIWLAVELEPSHDFTGKAGGSASHCDDVPRQAAVAAQLLSLPFAFRARTNYGLKNPLSLTSATGEKIEPVLEVRARKASSEGGDPVGFE
jgi:hypothetical protein